MKKNYFPMQLIIKQETGKKDDQRPSK